MDESILTLADFLIVLHEVKYEPVDGALPKVQFGRVYYPFLGELVTGLDKQLRECEGGSARNCLISGIGWWNDVASKCL